MLTKSFHHNLPFNPISKFYLERFGEKVYKIPVSIVDTCPNRMGFKNMETCVFCDEWGSAARKESFELDLRQQISKFKSQIQNHYHAKKFLVYFQAYTSTFKKFLEIEKSFQTAQQDSDVVGIVVGTRPDCLSKALLDLWKRTNQAGYLTVELGVQSFFDHHLDFLKRGHSRAQVLDAILKIHHQAQVDVGVHLMFGLPNETDDHIIETADLINSLPVQNVKIHNLHVLKNTPLEKIHADGKFTPCSRDDYYHKVQLFLEHLSGRVYVHRLAAFAPRWDELIAPAWTADKMGTYQGLIDRMKSNLSFQSLLHEKVQRN